jgi:hypothetical protein
MACPGDTVTMTTFSPGSCSGDTYLRLYDPSSGSQLAYNDDTSSRLCSQIIYTFASSDICRQYELREGCYNNNACSGQIYFNFEFPSSVPSKVPTQVPSSKSSYIPTQAMSSTPSIVPTQSPSSNPSIVPTQSPSSNPTNSPTQ